MIYGFTGTHHTITQRQRSTFVYLLNELQVTELHLGDCIGADETAFYLAKANLTKIRTVIHPPIDSKKRAHCEGDLILPEKEYLDRNHDIVLEGKDGLIAIPDGKFEILRSGTWATIRHARKLDRDIHIIWPDGTFRFEDSQDDGGMP